ncbi:MAG TPA: fibronectin type III domain-containing protein, partial [Acidimicrobiales bacterium]|nr:fibronectin type III domain-containing protein [Acidimicrobiales bacterium]
MGRVLRRVLAGPVVLAMAFGGLVLVAAPAGASSVTKAAVCYGYAGTTSENGPGCLLGFGGSTTGVAGATEGIGVAFTTTAAITGAGYIAIDGRSTATGIRFSTSGYQINITTLRYTAGENRTVVTRTAGCTSAGAASVSGTGSFVTVPVPVPVPGFCTIPANADIEVLVSSVVNPPTAGTKHLQTYTSRDTTPVQTNALTIRSVPSAPANLTATAGSQHVALQWTASTTTGGTAITGYDVYEGTTPGGELATPVNASPLPATATSFTVGTLTNGTTYYFTVKAKNAIGTSAASDEVSATPATAPAPPTLTDAVGGNTHVALTWAPPTTDGGSTVTGYDVYEGTAPTSESATPANATPIPGTATGYTLTGLTNGTPYYFTVTASNDAGTSVASNELSAAPITTPPDPPTGLTASRGDQQTTLSWTAPATDGGTPITTYEVFVGTTSGTESTTPVTTVPGTATTATVTGLSNGTTYYFTVKAVSTLGTSAASGEASATPATLPGPPRTVSATGDNRSATLHWSSPATDGGTAVTEYEIFQGTTPGAEGSTPVATVPGPATGYSVTTLTNGTTYYFTVIAVNDVGPSTPSTEVTATPAGTASSPPAHLQARSGTGRVQLSWQPPATTGGYPITYDVYQGTTPGGESPAPVQAAVVGMSAVVTTLTNGTTYYFTVTAVNSVGTSEPSNEASATPAATGTT